MTEVEYYIHNLPTAQKEVISYFHTLFSNQLQLTPKIRYRVPFYYHKSWICYLNPQKEGGVELVFLRGNELSNIQGLLDPKDRKQVAGITFENVSQIPEEAINEVIQEALLLDETKPYASKRSTNKK